MKTTVILFLVVMGLCTPAMANNGMQTVEFEAQVPMDAYVECLGEFLAGPFWVKAKGHEFETPSGTVHLLDNWTYTTLFTGQSTGRMWTNRGASPFHDNILKNGETFGFNDNSVAKPVDEGPMWRGTYNFKLRIDANGDVAVEVEVQNIKCLGPKHKD